MALPHIRCWEDSEISVSIYHRTLVQTFRGFRVIEAMKWFTWEINQALAEERIFKLNIQIYVNTCLLHYTLIGG